MEKIEKLRGRFTELFFDKENEYIGLIKGSEVVILCKKDFSLLCKIPMKDCVYGAFYKDKVVLASVSKIEIFDLSAQEIVFFKRIKCQVKTNYLLRDNLFLCVDEKNRIFVIRLDDYSLTELNLPAVYFLSIQEYGGKYLAAYKKSRFSDDCEVALFDENFNLTESCFSASSISALTLKVVNDAVFYVEDNCVMKYDLKKKEFCEGFALDFLPLAANTVQGKYLLTNYIYTIIIDDEFNIFREYESEGILDFHMISGDEKQLYICKNNGVYID